MRFDAVINLFCFRAQMGQKLRINGTGDQRRPFIHINRATQVLSEVTREIIEPGTYDLLERNLSIGEIVESLASLYPELEMIYVNRHMKMRELVVTPDERLKSLLPESFDLKADLENFKEHFAF
jgi:UDP-glucose 4-epimerase